MKRAELPGQTVCSAMAQGGKDQVICEPREEFEREEEQNKPRIDIWNHVVSFGHHAKDSWEALKN